MVLAAARSYAQRVTGVVTVADDGPQVIDVEAAMVVAFASDRDATGLTGLTGES